MAEGELSVNDGEMITAVREQRDKVRSRTSVDQIISRGRTVRARRRIPCAAAGLAVAAAAGTALALSPGGLRGAAPARSTGTIRTAAFTLAEHADGTATLTINPKVLLEPGTLQGDLARDGIRAMVTAGSFCTSDPAPAGSRQVWRQVMSFPGTPADPGPRQAVVINPAVMPAGMELSFGNFQLRNGRMQTSVALISTRSYTCTSSAPTAPPPDGVMIFYAGAR
jgi:hypothetical protein